MSKHEKITQEYLKKFLDYSTETGIFKWRHLVSKNYISLGDAAGSVDAKGYIQIKLNKRFYKARRLAWLYVHGYFPSDQIDHKNNIKTDNRIDNLRECNNSQNQQNQLLRNVRAIFCKEHHGEFYKELV